MERKILLAFIIAFLSAYVVFSHTVFGTEHSSTTFGRQPNDVVDPWLNGALLRKDVNVELNTAFDVNLPIFPVKIFLGSCDGGALGSPKRVKLTSDDGVSVRLFVSTGECNDGNMTLWFSASNVPSHHTDKLHLYYFYTKNPLEDVTPATMPFYAYFEAPLSYVDNLVQIADDGVYIPDDYAPSFYKMPLDAIAKNIKLYDSNSLETYEISYPFMVGSPQYATTYDFDYAPDINTGILISDQQKESDEENIFLYVFPKNKVYVFSADPSTNRATKGCFTKRDGNTHYMAVSQYYLLHMIFSSTGNISSVKRYSTTYHKFPDAPRHVCCGGGRVFVLLWNSDKIYTADIPDLHNHGGVTFQDATLEPSSTWTSVSISDMDYSEEHNILIVAGKYVPRDSPLDNPKNARGFIAALSPDLNSIYWAKIIRIGDANVSVESIDVDGNYVALFVVGHGDYVSTLRITESDATVVPQSTCYTDFGGPWEVYIKYPWRLLCNSRTGSCIYVPIVGCPVPLPGYPGDYSNAPSFQHSSIELVDLDLDISLRTSGVRFYPETGIIEYSLGEPSISSDPKSFLPYTLSDEDVNVVVSTFGDKIMTPQTIGYPTFHFTGSDASNLLRYGIPLMLPCGSPEHFTWKYFRDDLKGIVFRDGSKSSWDWYPSPLPDCNIDQYDKIVPRVCLPDNPEVCERTLTCATPSDCQNKILEANSLANQYDVNVCVFVSNDWNFNQEFDVYDIQPPTGKYVIFDGQCRDLNRAYFKISNSTNLVILNAYNVVSMYIYSDNNLWVKNSIIVDPDPSDPSIRKAEEAHVWIDGSKVYFIDDVMALGNACSPRCFNSEGGGYSCLGRRGIINIAGGDVLIKRAFLYGGEISGSPYELNLIDVALYNPCDDGLFLGAHSSGPSVYLKNTHITALDDVLYLIGIGGAGVVNIDLSSSSTSLCGGRAVHRTDAWSVVCNGTNDLLVSGEWADWVGPSCSPIHTKSACFVYR